MEDYIKLNKKMWNDRVHTHINSEMYAMNEFMNGKSSLNDIELSLLGDIRGKKILHLQCHFGQDSLSLARMGADVTGVDFSETAISKARELNEELKLDVSFVVSDVLKLDQKLKEEFDIVYTSYGAIGWLPDINKWANIVSGFLKPGGQFIFAEFHPVLWMYDENIKEISYGYFNSGEIIEENEGTYADRNAPLKHTSIIWNHPLHEVFTALLDENLQLNHFKEYDYSPYDIFNHSTKNKDGYQIKNLEGKFPLVYSLVFNKK